TFARAELDQLLDLAFAGIARLGAHQTQVLADRLAAVDELRQRGPRRPAPAKSEKGVWGPPRKSR
ncbi:MAG: hypothetical protein NDJ75_12165, partial [Thermoanaerobaculia bacterium]|nr:hypothetical protein [Thermoanaerobaculia bacterium]